MRRAWLCGLDQFTEQSFEHRRGWIEDRLLELADVCGISLYDYAVTRSHVHVVLRVADSLETSDHTSAARRIASIYADASDAGDALQPVRSGIRGVRLSLRADAYLELIDWTARLVVPKRRWRRPTRWVSAGSSGTAVDETNYVRSAAFSVNDHPYQVHAPRAGCPEAELALSKTGSRQRDDWTNVGASI